MKQLLFSTILSISTLILFAQKDIKVKVLSATERLETISTDVIETYKINIQVYEVYEIKYNGETEYLVLCESKDEINNNTDTINKKIKAVLLRRSVSGIE